MKEPKLKFWHPIVGILLFNAIDTLVWNLETTNKFLIIDLTDWASGVCLLLLLYIIIRNSIRAIKSRTNRQSPEASTYADEKEKELLRKQNEILVHLIQDEHREGDR